MKISFLWIQIALFCSSCAFIIQVDQPSPLTSAAKVDKKKTYCKKKAEVTLVSSNAHLARQFHEIFLEQNKHLSFKELSVVWTLLQMNARPDATTLNSRLQVILGDQQGQQYYDFGNTNLLQALEKLTGGHSKLLQLAKKVDLNFQRRIFIDQTLSDYLQKNQNLINSPVFYRGGQILKKGESIQKMAFSKLIQNSKKGHNEKTSHQFNYSSDIICNFDPGLYKNKIYLISPQGHTRRNLFALKMKNRYFVAITSSIPTPLKSHLHLPIIPSNKSPLPASLCQLNSKKLTLISTDGRDPGQFLVNQIDRFQGGEKKVDFNQILNLIAAPRRLNLLNPERVLVENESSHLSEGYPTYKVSKLGDVTALYKGDPIIDSRSESDIFCIYE